MEHSISRPADVVASVERASLAIGRLAEIFSDQERARRVRRILALAEAIGGARARGQLVDAADILRYQARATGGNRAIWIASRIDILAQRIARRTVRQASSADILEIYASSWRLDADPNALTVKGRPALPGRMVAHDLAVTGSGRASLGAELDVEGVEAERLAVESGPRPASISASIEAWYARHCLPADSPDVTANERPPAALLRIAYTLADLIAIEPASPALVQTARLALPLLVRQEGLLKESQLFFGLSLDGLSQRQIVQLTSDATRSRQGKHEGKHDAATGLLAAIARGAERSVALVTGIERARKAWQKVIPRRKDLHFTLECLHQSPLLSSEMLVDISKQLCQEAMPLRSAQHHLKELEKKGVVREITGQSRYQFYLATSPALLGN